MEFDCMAFLLRVIADIPQRTLLMRLCFVLRAIIKRPKSEILSAEDRSGNPEG